MSKFDIDGILLLNKSQGYTSNSALQKAKRLFNAKKAGHTGSLDPLATGMLPICFGQATKFAQFFINDDKAYEVSATIGVKTDSGDKTGQVVQTQDVPALDEDLIKETLLSFIGDIEQIPPMFSAVKVDGKRLYKHARKGRDIERPSRKIKIHSIRLVSFEPEKEEGQLTLKVFCSKGTYIRTLVEDIATALGTIAHVERLHRDFVGQFKTSQMVNMDTLIELVEKDGPESVQPYLVPLTVALPPWPKIQLNDTHVLYFQQGQIIKASQLPQEGWVQVCDSKGDFVGLGMVHGQDQLKPKRLMKTQ